MEHLGTKRIETERLILRRFTPEDAEAMYQNWASDPEVTKFLTWPVHESTEVTRAVLADWISSYNNIKKYEWCIEYRENHQAIGSIGVVAINDRVESMEIGYCISRSCWHQGITSEALAAVMKYLLEEVGAKRLESRHDLRNPNSGRVMKKCGMKYEGTRIQADWNNTGICDCAFYGYVKGITEEMNCGNAESGEIEESEKLVYEEGSGKSKSVKHVISDETIEYVGILAKLELNDAEKERARKDMGEMLDYIDKLNELDTEGVEPMSHIFADSNVFREDVITNADGSEAALANAPEKKDGGFKVPKTIG